MSPFWLLESDAYGSSLDPLKAEIRRQGMSFGIIHHEMFTSGYQERVGNRAVDENDCVVFIGTWPLWRHIQLHWSSWIPGGWCATEKLDCAAYYPRFAKYLLNKRHAITTGAEAVRRQDELFEAFGRDGLVFVRPTGCLKIFNGRCVDACSFASAIAPARYDSATKIVVAEPRSIGREWRFVIAEHRPIAASQYYDGGAKCLARGCPTEVREFVEGLLLDVAWEPDEVFIMDVCESEGKLNVLELNGFSCAGLYECDLANVVARVRTLAEVAWKKAHESA
jgi:hypothetical protein